VLNYRIPSNHVHLLIKDTGPSVIADSMQLIAGCTAQEYNRRKDNVTLASEFAPRPARTVELSLDSQ
jgi:hypothetical protein